jgi:hypothetical protein
MPAENKRDTHFRHVHGLCGCRCLSPRTARIFKEDTTTLIRRADDARAARELRTRAAYAR